MYDKCFIEEDILSYVTNHTGITSNLIKTINTPSACPFINKGTEILSYAQVKHTV
ncbi:hypothetical protein NEPAR06_2247 [Nematocida parisii]|uniref:Uncharacterized protein n=1 Tax=Nematocida parisii (strain ERTm3) TaxID=935791 RepID=I3EHZ3_NEMP3|nr:uncharacterized protein NEPG_02437 [Nematocida parisii ERTm1]EIJ88840.1 hypothetical protein NEQG_00659 [Nematocida parisii ERTm3]KAI5146181.1 hypothetical protein NEPAR07_2172 [Nematocida parisii]EIJ92746.1 hypothetical protein NEPG_02437 [Nematocida parisii ERTm1]KAI5156701.1 hypothetical protein NEPAR06_2247 [Nematocida parisii]KAI5158938.1 hypothetical protein NEPAR05_2285 [Nematocida parisii]|eukprot:XP_013060264.1 hypothetical protein NEPG_02437 [Nematocida parisii ERTm1]